MSKVSKTLIMALLFGCHGVLFLNDSLARNPSKVRCEIGAFRQANRRLSQGSSRGPSRQRESTQPFGSSGLGEVETSGSGGGSGRYQVFHARIHQCCRAITSPHFGLNPPGPLSRTIREAYQIGATVESSRYNNSDYSFQRPRQIQGRTVAFEYLGFTAAPAEQRLASWLGAQWSATTTYLSEGALSHVFMRHPALGADQLNRESLARSQATSVVKVRNVNPWQRGFMDAAEMLRRDLALSGVVEALSEGVQWRGQRLVRTARILSDDRAHSYGVMEQEFVRGPSVLDLKTALDTIAGPLSEAGNRTWALQILREAGIDPTNQSDLVDMRSRIDGLQQFYEDTHYDVLEFCRVNRIPIFDTAQGRGDSREVGLDLGRGRNVIWSPSERMFVIVDW